LGGFEAKRGFFTERNGSCEGPDGIAVRSEKKRDNFTFTRHKVSPWLFPRNSRPSGQREKERTWIKKRMMPGK